MPYRPIRTLEELQTYLSGATHIAFDFETAPDEPYRHEDRAALDAHKSHIAGISFSVAEGDGIYLPIATASVRTPPTQPPFGTGWLPFSPIPLSPKSPTTSPSNRRFYTLVASSSKRRCTTPSPPRRWSTKMSRNSAPSQTAV